MRSEAIPFAVAAWLFLSGVVLQVFLAGMGLFGLSDFKTHDGFGWLLAAMPLFVVLPLATIAQVDRRTGWLTLLLVLLTVFQPELAMARKTDPVMAALHPVNAMLIFAVALFVARRSLLVLRRRDAPAPDGSADPIVPALGDSSRVDPGR